MNVVITDTEALQNVGIRELTTYLRTKDWRQVDRYFDTGFVWTTSTGSPKIVLPRSTELDDYVQVIADALATLSRFEKRSQAQILRDIEETNADIIRLVLLGTDITDGTVPLEEANQLVRHASDMMMAIACSTVQPRAIFTGRKPAEATEYVQRIRLGQTERGSFVIALRSEVPPRLSGGSESLFPEITTDTTEPFERRVTLMLAHALTETQNALDETLATGEIESFYKATQVGVSANLCEAIAGLALPDRERDVSIRIAWSSSRSVARATPSSVTFSSDRLPVLREVARVLKEKATYDAFNATGPVVRLERAPTGDSGSVTIVGFVDGTARRIQLELNAMDHQKAIEAYEKAMIVSVEGELQRYGRSYRLLNPRNFTISDE